MSVLDWLRRRWLSLLGPLIVLAMWEAAVHTGFLSPVLFPAPSVIFLRFLDLVRGDSPLAGDALLTVRRLLLTAGIAAGLGVATGVLVAAARWVGNGVESVLAFLYPIPSILFLPMISFVFGRTEATLLMTAAVTPVIMMAFATAFGVRQIDETLVEAGRNYGAHRLRFFARVLLPGAMSSVLAGFRVALGFSLITVVALEMVMTGDGLGGLLWESWRILRVRDMYVALVAVAVLGLLATRGFAALVNKLMPWQAEGKAIH